MSHTRLDKTFCDLFDNACARVGIKAFRSEFETIVRPAHYTIREQMNKSSAMFLLIGKELVNMQQNCLYDLDTAHSWKYTQNWIAYEVGLASQRGIDVWVLCDDVPINFPVPYFNHYQPFAGSHGVDWLRDILDKYAKFGRLPSPPLEIKNACPNRKCGMEFFLWAYHDRRPFDVTCPQCLQTMKYR